MHGPPEDFDIEEFERQADWDDFYESEELMKAHAENWAAQAAAGLSVAAGWGERKVRAGRRSCGFLRKNGEIIA